MTGRIVLVTGTDTGVGKTIVTAALAATALGRVVVVKPAQTGIDAGEPTDAEVVHHLTGVDVQTFVELPEPLAPDTAARRAGVDLPTIDEIADRVVALAEEYDAVIVEGAGGVLVHLDLQGGSIGELAMELEYRGRVEVVVVCAAGLGTLNHTALTVEALMNRNIDAPSLVIGAWPDLPGLAERCNLEDLPRITGEPLRAVIPFGAGRLTPEEFRAQAPGWFSAS